MSQEQQEQREKARKKRKLEADRDADMIMAYMAGNVGAVYNMEAAAAMASE
jgi:hypothetical protein